MLKHVVLNAIGLSGATIEELHLGDGSTSIELFHCSEESLIVVFKGVVASDGELIQARTSLFWGTINIIWSHTWAIVIFLNRRTKYTLFLAACAFCILQGCDEFVLNGEPVWNEYDCPLLTITKRVYSALSRLWPDQVCSQNCSWIQCKLHLWFGTQL